MTQGNAEVLSLRAQCDDLTQRLSRLQQWADDRGVRVVNEVAAGVHDPVSAQVALDTYDAEWFASLVYSRPVVRRIAERLAAAVRPFPYLDASYLGAVAADRS